MKYKGITTVSAILLVGLTGAAFWLSFTALVDLAQRRAAVSAGIAWLFPLVIDGGMIAAAVAVLRNELLQEPARYQRALVVLFTAGSVALNAYHALHSGALAAVIGAIPPLVAFLAFDVVLMPQVRSNVERAGVAASVAALRSERASVQAEVYEMQEQAEAIAAKIAESEDRLAELRRETRKERREQRKAEEDARRSAHACDWCGREFGSRNGLSAHLAHCEAYKAQQTLITEEVQSGNGQQ